MKQADDYIYVGFKKTLYQTVSCVCVCKSIWQAVKHSR